MNFDTRKKLLIILGISIALVSIFGVTYAFFVAGVGDAAKTGVDAGSGYVDNLIFESGDEISLHATQENMQEAGGSLVGTTTSKAILKANDNTNTATDNYYVYFNITNNTYIYTSPTSEPEMLLTVTNHNGDIVDHIIEGVEFKEITDANGTIISGYDITTYKGLLELGANIEITSTSRDPGTIHNWTAVLTHVNLTTNQALNGGAILESEFILQKDEILPPGYESILANNGGIEVIKAKGDPDFTVAATSVDTGMYAVLDDYGMSYYYRGEVDNNHLYFNGIYWRIVRVNGDKSIRLIYNGTAELTLTDAVIRFGSKAVIGASNFNTSYDDNAYVGYMYTLGERQGLSTSSTIKTLLESWYSTNMSIVDSMIADNLFCYDRGLAESGWKSSSYGVVNGVYSGTGIGTSSTLYKAAERLTGFSSSLIAGGTGPSLECMDKIDAYTVDDEVNGNGALTEKIGLLSADEATMAGLTTNVNNSTNYLYIGNDYWLGSPFGYVADNSFFMWAIWSNGSVSSFSSRNPIPGVRPVISLNSDVKLRGTGEWDNPYIVVE